MQKMIMISKDSGHVYMGRSGRRRVREKCCNYIKYKKFKLPNHKY